MARSREVLAEPLLPELCCPCPGCKTSDSERLSVSFQVGCHSCICFFASLSWHCPQLQRSAAPWWSCMDPSHASDFLERFSLGCFPMQHPPGPVGLPKAATVFMSGLCNGCHDPTVIYAKPAWEKRALQGPGSRVDRGFHSYWLHMAEGTLDSRCVAPV